MKTEYLAKATSRKKDVCCHTVRRHTIHSNGEVWRQVDPWSSVMLRLLFSWHLSRIGTGKTGTETRLWTSGSAFTELLPPVSLLSMKVLQPRQTPPTGEGQVFKHVNLWGTLIPKREQGQHRMFFKSSLQRAKDKRPHVSEEFKTFKVTELSHSL